VNIIILIPDLRGEGREEASQILPGCKLRTGYLLLAPDLEGFLDGVQGELL
jgi:hypothetical protein